MSGQDSDSKPRRSGRVRHEPGGRAVWEWAIESGRHAIDSTSRLLKKLDLSSLRLLGDDEKLWEKDGAKMPPDDPSPRPGEMRNADVTPELEPGASRGFNPYDTRTPVGRGVTRSMPPKGPPRPRITQPVRPAEKKGFIARLFRRR